MKIHKYETIYPRTLWIVNVENDDPTSLLKRFVFFKNLPGWSTVDGSIDDELCDSAESAIAGCYIVQEKSTGILGMLLVIFRSGDMDTATIAHESVHIADYYFQVTGCNSEDFTDGNEAYAYLVGWAAGCIANVLIKEKKYE